MPVLSNYIIIITEVAMATFYSDAEIAEGTMAIAGVGGSNADSNAPTALHTAEVMGGPMAIAVPTGSDADHHNSTPPATAPHTAEVVGGAMGIAAPTGSDADHHNSTQPATAPHAAEPDVPPVSLTTFAEWCRISKCFRRGELVYIQFRIV